MYKNEKTLQALLVVIVFILVVACWELGVKFWQVPSYLLPPPSQIFAQLVKLLQSGLFWENFQVTMIEVLLGYVCGVVLAALLGVSIAQAKIFQLALLPILLLFKPYRLWLWHPYFYNGLVMALPRKLLWLLSFLFSRCSSTS